MESAIIIKGLKRKDFQIKPEDKLTVKMAMLIEGQCTIGVYEAIEKYGYTEQRYYQLLRLYNEGGSEAIRDKKRGSTKQHVRTKKVQNQIIRTRFLDPFSSSSVISQKLNQTGHKVSVRSVERTITEFGLQKKRMFLIPKISEK